MTAVLALAVVVGGGVGVVHASIPWASVSGGLKSVSVGPAGVWGANSAGKIYYRAGTYGNPSSAGSTWTLIPGGLVQVDVGDNIVWGVGSKDHIYYRQGISCTTPTGTRWQYVDGLLKHVSVGNDGQVWGVNSANKIFIRLGISYSNPGGSSWKQIGGSLKQISVGDAGVWGVNAGDNIYYRIGTRGNPFSAGSDWQQVDGLLKYISSGSNNIVIGVNAKYEIFIRQGVSDSNPAGTSWAKQNGLLSVVDAFGVYWGVSKTDRIYHS